MFKMLNPRHYVWKCTFLASLFTVSCHAAVTSSPVTFNPSNTLDDSCNIAHNLQQMLQVMQTQTSHSELYERVSVLESKMRLEKKETTNMHNDMKKLLERLPQLEKGYSAYSSLQEDYHRLRTKMTTLVEEYEAKLSALAGEIIRLKVNQRNEVSGPPKMGLSMLKSEDDMSRKILSKDHRIKPPLTNDVYKTLCPESRVGQSLISVEGHCFYYTENWALSWDAAQRYCQSLGGQLISEAIFNKFSNIFPFQDNIPHWIGSFNTTSLDKINSTTTNSTFSLNSTRKDQPQLPQTSTPLNESVFNQLEGSFEESAPFNSKSLNFPLNDSSNNSTLNEFLVEINKLENDINNSTLNIIGDIYSNDNTNVNVGDFALNDNNTNYLLLNITENRHNSSAENFKTQNHSGFLDEILKRFTQSRNKRSIPQVSGFKNNKFVSARHTDETTYVLCNTVHKNDQSKLNFIGRSCSEIYTFICDVQL